VIYSVRNTFGERHAYVAPASRRALRGRRQQTRTKIFHVSPFIDMAHAIISACWPRQGRAAQDHETEQGEALLAATFVGEAKTLGNGSLAACLLKFPFMTWKIMVAIHWRR